MSDAPTPVKDAKLAVVGGRHFNDYGYMRRILDAYKDKHGISLIISGGAPGADSLAERYAHENEIDLMVFMAKWSKEGNAAGPRRTLRIVDACDAMTAFPDQDSKGTYIGVHGMGMAKKPVYVFKCWEKNGG